MRRRVLNNSFFLSPVFIRVTWKIHLPSKFPKINRIFERWMHGNMRPIWGNFEGRWIFQVTLIKMDFSYQMTTNSKTWLWISFIQIVQGFKKLGFNFGKFLFCSKIENFGNRVAFYYNKHCVFVMYLIEQKQLLLV